VNFIFGALGWGQLVKNVQTNLFSGTQIAAPATFVIGDFAMGQVAVGDLCLVMGAAQIAAPGALTFANLTLSNATGTATVVYGINSVAISYVSYGIVAGLSIQFPWFTLGRCTVAGTWIPRYIAGADQNGTVVSNFATLYVIRGS